MKQHSRNVGLSGAAFLLAWLIGGGPSPAWARNADVETAIRSSGDLSMFYQALQNTGILDDLAPHQRYTVFAPTDASWEQINPHVYPCFYAVQCRPQIAALLRNYIVAGDYALEDLAMHGGVPSEGARPLHIAKNYPGDFTVEGHKILTRNEVDGNTVYRVDGVIAKDQDLMPFQTVGLKYGSPVAGLAGGSADSAVRQSALVDHSTSEE